MAWVKMGDDADMYPRLMEAASHPKADARTVNELFGFIMRCAAYSAAHLTDSVIEMGVVYTYAGGNPDVLQIALDTGLLEWVETPKGAEAEAPRGPGLRTHQVTRRRRVEPSAPARQLRSGVAPGRDRPRRRPVPLVRRRGLLAWKNISPQGHTRSLEARGGWHCGHARRGVYAV